MIAAAGGMLAVVLRFVALAATTGALGAWVFGRFVIERLAAGTSPEQRDALRGFAIRTAAWCAAVLALSAPLRLFVPAASGLPLPAGGATLAALQTLWGQVLVAQGVAACIAAVSLVVSRRELRWPLAAEAGLGVLLVATPFIGHAGFATELRVVSVLIDVVHVAAAGGWVGALVWLTWATVRVRRSPDGPSRAAALMVAFHPVALTAAPTVFVTGLATAWLRMGAPIGIASPSYSGLFVTKLLLVGVTGAIGAGHSKLATRRMRTLDLNAVGRTLLAECLLAVLVLGVTAVLAGTAPIG